MQITCAFLFFFLLHLSFLNFFSNTYTTYWFYKKSLKEFLGSGGELKFGNLPLNMAMKAAHLILLLHYLRVPKEPFLTQWHVKRLVPIILRVWLLRGC